MEKMKKIKSFFCIVILSIFLVGNVFAENTTSGVFFSFFDGLAKSVTSLFSKGDYCKPRQCTNCEGPDCRPPDND